MPGGEGESNNKKMRNFGQSSDKHCSTNTHPQTHPTIGITILWCFFLGLSGWRPNQRSVGALPCFDVCCLKFGQAVGGICRIHVHSVLAHNMTGYTFDRRKRFLWSRVARSQEKRHERPRRANLPSRACVAFAITESSQSRRTPRLLSRRLEK